MIVVGKQWRIVCVILVWNVNDLTALTATDTNSEGAVLNPSLADFFHTNVVSHQCPYTEHANFNQIEYAMNC